MKNKILKFALAGAGAVAAHHVNALRMISDVEVVQVWQRNEQKLRTFARQFQLDWSAEYRDLLNNPEIDVIDIVVPSGLHAELGIQAARAGKHVVVEKPIDVSLKKADDLIAACNDARVTLAVISQMRFNSDMLKVYDLISRGKLGTLIQADAFIKWYRSQAYYDSAEWRGTWALDGGGPFINQGIHFIDLLLSVMGPVKWVSARTRTVGHRIEVEDIGMAMVEFQSGAQGIIQAATALYPGLPARLEIHGTKGTLIFEGERLSFLHVEGEEPYRKGDTGKGGAAAPMAIDVMPFVREFEDVAAAIRERREPKVNGAEARRALQLVLAIYESAQSGRPVELQV